MCSASSLACRVRLLSQSCPALEGRPQTVPISWCPGVLTLAGGSPGSGEGLERGPPSPAPGGSSGPPGRPLCILLARDKHFLLPIDSAQILLPFSSIPGMLSSVSSLGEKAMRFRIPRPALVNGPSAIGSGFTVRSRSPWLLTSAEEGRPQVAAAETCSRPCAWALRPESDRQHLPGRGSPGAVAAPCAGPRTRVVPTGLGECLPRCELSRLYLPSQDSKMKLKLREDKKQAPYPLHQPCILMSAGPSDVNYVVHAFA